MKKQHQATATSASPAPARVSERQRLAWHQNLREKNNGMRAGIKRHQRRVDGI